MATLEQLRAQFDALNRQNLEPSKAGMGGLGVSRTTLAREQDASNARFQQMTDLQNQMRRMQTAAQGDPAADAEASFQRAMGLTEGRGQEIQNDPYTTAALGYLQGVTGGQETPFNEQVQTAMLARRSDANAAGEAAQRQMWQDQMAANGMSAQDPAAQAAMRELTARRQQSNNAAIGDIQSNANVQNFNARMAGAGQMAAVRGAQNAQVNQMNLAGAHMLYDRETTVPTQGVSSGGGWSSAPSQPVTNNRTAPAGAYTGNFPQYGAAWNPQPAPKPTLQPQPTQQPKPALQPQPAQAPKPTLRPSAFQNQDPRLGPVAVRY
jgi:hypothetical protein